MPDEEHSAEELPIGLEAEETAEAFGVPRLLLSEAAIEAMREHGYTDTSRECGGVMVGQKLEGDRGPVVLVEAVIPGAHTDQHRGSVTFTHDTWEQINRQKDQKYQDLRIVGWYHTHPGFGIFLSEFDRFIQRNFFDLPWNVAFVLDPHSGETGAFGWQEGQISRLGSYEVYGSGKEAAVAEEKTGETSVLPGAERGSQRSQPLAAALMILVLLISAVNLGLLTRVMRAVERTTVAAPAAPPGPLSETESETRERGETPVVPTGETPVLPIGETPVLPPRAEHEWHTVQAGDTLWDLAKRFYGRGDMWRLIAAANGLQGRNWTLEPGMKLRLPVPPEGLPPQGMTEEERAHSGGRTD